MGALHRVRMGISCRISCIETLRSSCEEICGSVLKATELHTFCPTHIRQLCGGCFDRFPGKPASFHLHGMIWRNDFLAIARALVGSPFLARSKSL
jgi:hypothetical protein